MFVRKESIVWTTADGAIALSLARSVGESRLGGIQSLYPCVLSRVIVLVLAPRVSSASLRGLSSTVGDGVGFVCSVLALERDNQMPLKLFKFAFIRLYEIANFKTGGVRYQLVGYGSAVETCTGPVTNEPAAAGRAEGGRDS